MMNEILIIVDCNYLCYVNKYGLSHELSYRGGRTEIIFGFFRQILEFARQFETTHFAFCWDSKESVRKNIYPEYKTNRHQHTTEEQKILDSIAYQQFDEIKNTSLEMFGFQNIFSKEGYESDDIIASVVKNRKGKNIVISNDNDLYQLLDGCYLYNTTKKQITSKDIFTKKYGIAPYQWVDVKCLAGCISDNVSGIPGIGEVTALKYVKEELKNGKALQKIQDAKDMIQRNKILIKLPYQGTGVFPIKKPRLDWSIDQFKDFCFFYDFKSFLEKQLSEWIKVFHLI